MKAPTAQGKHEARALEAALDQIRSEWRFQKNFGLPQLLKRWIDFVQEVESGYRLSIYDYTHDLSMRDLLDQVMAQVPSRLGQEIAVYIAPWDNRFREASRPVVKPIEEPVEGIASEWWYRVPRDFDPTDHG